MICALTVRKLKPGAGDEFAEKFAPDDPSGAPPSKWVEFQMLRKVGDPDEIVTFGFFDGTLEELEQSQDEGGYADHIAKVAPLIDSVLVNGLYEVERAMMARDAGA